MLLLAYIALIWVLVLGFIYFDSRQYKPKKTCKLHKSYVIIRRYK